MPAAARALALRPAGTRRAWILLTALALLTLGVLHARADERVIRIGYQKYGTLVLLKGKGLLEQRLKPLGYRVTWAEFPSGPPLMEALNAGAVDLGSAGEAPPIFAQAANPDLLYVGHEPAAPKGEAILVAKDSPIRTVADLRGKKIALNKGSNVHYFLVRALEQAGVPYEAVTPTFLAPADGAAAFARGAVDAWAIWDPYLASGERSTGGRILVDGTDLVPNRQFYLSTRAFAATHGPALDATLAAIGEIDAWAKENTDAVAAELSPSVGIPAPILTVALRRLTYGVTPLNAETTADQQKVADTFHRLGLLPKPLDVASAVRKPGS
ncbi:sulfonate ABC transporter substrate-binding protein [Methylobacterium sp.]|uniref:sulfonate ABC transporter substrate-binding protein n=1 Tax=Methylobacterium sp. TaxID=409 RepID=UPI0025EDB63F|nr:sulfonate ABC transporter substrate-binding protein [Methylobacterium sp.]MBY0256607.1 sulfonate ABC transporter substrate-binding protein [Methylobacterium sp.]